MADAIERNKQKLDALAKAAPVFGADGVELTADDAAQVEKVYARAQTRSASKAAAAQKAERPKLSSIARGF